MNSQEWNKLVIEGGGEFLQSYEWGEFQKSLGKRVERIANKNFLAQTIFTNLPFGLEYAYVPRGPVMLENTEAKNFWGLLSGPKTNKTVFTEIEPAQQINFLGQDSTVSRQPKKTLILDISQSKEEIFARFHKNHRYSIRKAEKEDLNIVKESSWETFFKLSELSAKRQGIRNWSPNYYKNLWGTMSGLGMLEIWGVYQGNKLIASNLYILFGTRVIYLFSALNHKYRSYMAPHLLHWHAIQEFKERSYQEYDFWGIEPDKYKGVSDFKKRFGGKEIVYPGSFVKVERPVWYSLYKNIRKWR